MSNTTPRKRKAPQFYISNLFIFPALAGMLSSCDAVTNGVDFTLSSKVENPATEELTLVPETEVATQMPMIITLTSEPTKTNTPELTATATEMPTPTEVSLIEGNIFFDPQSEVDFDKVVESPSPIDEPEKFAVWQDEYLKMIEEKLKTYDGPVIENENGGIMYEAGVIVYRELKWQAVASYKFKWQEKDILTKTYIISDFQIGLAPFSVTYTTSNSIAFSQEVGYKTPPGEANMFIRYEWENAKEFVTDDFIDEYLPNRDENIDFTSWRKYFDTNDSNEEDKYRAFRTRFIFSRYDNYFDPTSLQTVHGF